MDAKTEELRAAHDALAEVYASRLAHVMGEPGLLVLTDAGFSVTFWAGRPADPDEKQPQGYLIARRR